MGAACKAVVYQWESQKRCPSPLFWQRIQDMEAGSEMIARERATVDQALGDGS